MPKGGQSRLRDVLLVRQAIGAAEMVAVRMRDDQMLDRVVVVVVVVHAQVIEQAEKLVRPVGVDHQHAAAGRDDHGRVALADAQHVDVEVAVWIVDHLVSSGVVGAERRTGAPARLWTS